MHEIAIAQGLVQQIQTLRKKTPFRRVSTIHIVCGQWNCLSPENLQFCFDAAVDSQEIRGAQIRVRRLSKSALCVDCETELDAPGAGCPQCRGTNIIRNDHAVYLHKLEVEAE